MLIETLHGHAVRTFEERESNQEGEISEEIVGGERMGNKFQERGTFFRTAEPTLTGREEAWERGWIEERERERNLGGGGRPSSESCR
jgi:hypothetical protein